MALLDSDAGLLVTAAPGTASTALREALLARSSVTEVPAGGEVRAAGIDVKHGTVTDRERAYWQSYDVTGRRLVETAHADDLALFGYAF